MTDRSILFTPSAKNDLISIARYTADKWGNEQALRYADLLDAEFYKISQGKDSSKSILDNRRSVRVSKCEHHYIFYLRPSDQQEPIIIAVLHERMDLMRCLKERL